MCGDGTNDVGALKHAHVGVALLSHPYDATKNEAKKKEEEQKQQAEGAVVDQNRKQPQPPVGPRRANAPIGSRQNANSRLVQSQNRLEQMMKEMEEEEKAKVIRLGDASIAAPFTSKFTSIQSSMDFMDDFYIKNRFFMLILFQKSIYLNFDPIFEPNNDF